MDPTFQPTTHYWQHIDSGGATDPIFAALRQQLGGAAQSPAVGITQHAVGQAFSSPAMQQALARISPATWQPQPQPSPWASPGPSQPRPPQPGTGLQPHEFRLPQGDTQIDWRHVPDTIGHWS